MTRTFSLLALLLWAQTAQSRTIPYRDWPFLPRGSDDERGLSLSKLPDGTDLLRWVRVGLLSRFGSGQDGSSTTVRVDVFHLGQEAAARTWSTRLVIDDWNAADGDVQFARDGRTATVYRARRDHAYDKLVWSSERFCLSGVTCVACGTEDPSAPPPAPRYVDLKAMSAHGGIAPRSR